MKILHIEKRIGVCSLSTIVSVYHKQSTYLYHKEPNYSARVTVVKYYQMGQDNMADTG